MVLVRTVVKHKMFYLMILPGLLTLLVFNYGPVYGIQLAFKNFMYNKGIMGSPWVGWDNFLYLWYDSGFWRALRNTFVISFGKLIFYFPAPIIVALLLNELRSPRFKRIIQSLLYIPHFFSWVIVSGIFVSLFSSTSGVLSKVSFELLGHRLPPMIVDPDYFLTIIFSTSVWHGVGWGTIIYLAAISGVNPELYESAVMDGANRFKQAIYITLPSIKFAIVMTLILSLGGTMNAGFDQIFNFYSPPTYEVGDIIDTYVYRKGIIDAGYGVSTAVGLFKSVINCALLFSANWFVKRLGEEGVF